ncbi:MAG: LEPR-XLL domain-containing protein, partial [Sterolibacterium sp.]
MRKSTVKNDRPDRSKSFAVSPLVSALMRVFRPAGRRSNALVRTTPVPVMPPSPPPIRFEAIEPRVLLSGDVNPAQTITGSIDVPGEVDQYGFTLAQNTRIVFDSLTNSSSFNWSLTGPKGAEVANRNFSSSDSIDAVGSPLLDLAAGDYTITVDGVTDTTGSYSFRLIDVQKTQEITPGTQVSGTLDPAKETDVYRFGATAGDRFYFDKQALAGGDVYWRLYDPYGKSVFGPVSMNSDIDVTTLAFDGSYTLLVEGRTNTSGTASYSFNVQKVTDDVAPMNVGTTVSGAIDHAGQRDFYNFSLTDATQVYFDALTNNANFNWTLTGPRGTVVSGRALTAADAANLSGSPAMNLAAGDYTLIIDSSADIVGNYSFRLLDIAQATMLTPGTPVAGQLNPANETDLYKFTASAGDQFYFDYQSVSSGNVTWRLLDPFGAIVFGPSSMGNGDVGWLTLGLGGTFTLLVEGALPAVGYTDYSFNVQKVNAIPVPLPLNTTTTSSSGNAGQRDTYSFTLTEAKQVYFDALTNSPNVAWTLTGPRGTVVTSRA